MQRTVMSMAHACAVIGQEWRDRKQREAFAAMSAEKRHALIDEARRAAEKIAGKPSGVPA